MCDEIVRSRDSGAAGGVCRNNSSCECSRCSSRRRHDDVWHQNPHQQPQPRQQQQRQEIEAANGRTALGGADGVVKVGSGSERLGHRGVDRTPGVNGLRSEF